MRESVIVNSILKYINSLPQGVAEKLIGNATGAGKADINACYKGRSLRIEVKSPEHGNKASQRQLVNLKRWRAAGAKTLVAYSLTDVKKLIKEIDNENDYSRDQA